MQWRPVLCLTLALLLGGCAQLGYYTQAVHGQLSLQGSAKPIDELLTDPEVDVSLKARLAEVKQIRAFAVSELGLPDNRSYTSYADLKRPYVLWNVVATPELSLVPIQWCFPIAGCVGYRGYYHEDDARAFAATLRSAGDDVVVGGVPAYSTLGWFSDPVLSTFVGYPDGELARMLFHELAHQIVYVKGDTQFNESFATTVEEEGVDRWMTLHGDQHQRDAYAAQQRRKQDFLALLLKYREKLQANYARPVDDGDKRARKAAIFHELNDAYQVLKANWGGYAGYDAWFAEPLTNAHLATIATYNDYVPAFKALLQQQGSFPKFYDAVRKLAHLDQADRQRRLALLAPAAPVATLTPNR
jgi:predicted aminopeptidase